MGLAQRLRLLDRLVNLRLITVAQFRQLLLVLLYNGGAFLLQLLYLPFEVGCLLVFGRKVFLGFGKVAFTYPRQNDIPPLVGFLHFGIQSGNIVLVLQHLLPVIFAVGLVLGRRADYTSLQSKLPHRLGVGVLISGQPRPLHNIVCRQTRSRLCPILFLALAGFALALARNDWHNRRV